MTDLGQAVKGITALGLGGFLFIVIGGALADVTSAPAFIDLRFWGVIYIIAAIGLAVVTVYALLRGLVN